MTKDRYDVAHSTSSEDRYGDRQNLDHCSGGIREDVMKWGWPGTVVQTVERAFNGEAFQAPEGVFRNIRGFSGSPVRCEQDVAITYPLVLKPPPGVVDTVPPALQLAAEKAKQIRGHYRFFGYSNGNVSFDPSFNAPAQFSLTVNG